MLPFTAAMPMDAQHQATVSVRVEERHRRGSDIKTWETELDPIAKYDVIWRGGQNHFVALYQPRFLYVASSDRRFPDERLVNPETINAADPNDHPFSLLHNGGFGFEMVRARWRLSAYQFAAYGPITTTALLIQAPWTGDGPPPDPNPIIPATIGARFTLLFAQTQLFVPIRLTPRTALTPGFVYNAFGGADRVSRGVIALTYGPFASLALEHAASRSDRFISTIGAGQVDTSFQDEREGVLILRSEATQAWRHYFSSHVTSEISGGGSIGGDSINGYTIFSLANASLLYDSWPVQEAPPGAAPLGDPAGTDHRLQMGASAKVQPWIDLFSGDLEQRLVLSTALNYSVDRWTFRAGVAHARVFNTPRSVAQYQIVLGEAGLRFRISPTVSADAGARVGWQDFNNAVRFNELTQVTFYGALTWAPLAARF
jgi:hypothetical protein